MTRTGIGMLASASLVAALAFSLPAAGQQITAQQEKMKTCNAEATSKQLKGDERQRFMSGCLTGKEPRELTAQQQKMVTCNRTAGDRQLKGDERKAFMKECLSARNETSTAPQARMRDCNEQAKGLKGVQRRSFMSSCLKGSGSAAVGGGR